MVILFDVVGTLFSLNKAKKAFREIGMRTELFDFWLVILYQSAMASMLAGKYTPFNVLARSTLEHLFAQENIDEAHLNRLLGSLQEIELWDDAPECLHSLRSDGHRLVAVTNSNIADSEGLLERSGIRRVFERVYSAQTIEACKPHQSFYEFFFRTMFAGPYECCIVTAHGWDIIGADSVGMNSVYVDRLEIQWPFPEGPPGFVVSNLNEVPRLISKAFGKPASREKGGIRAPFKWYGEA